MTCSERRTPQRFREMKLPYTSVVTGQGGYRDSGTFMLTVRFNEDVEFVPGEDTMMRVPLYTLPPGPSVYVFGPRVAVFNLVTNTGYAPDLTKANWAIGCADDPDVIFEYTPCKQEEPQGAVGTGDVWFDIAEVDLWLTVVFDEAWTEDIPLIVKAGSKFQFSLTEFR